MDEDDVFHEVISKEKETSSSTRLCLPQSALSLKDGRGF